MQVSHKLILTLTWYWWRMEIRTKIIGVFLSRKANYDIHRLQLHFCKKVEGQIDSNFQKMGVIPKVGGHYCLDPGYFHHWPLITFYSHRLRRFRTNWWGRMWWLKAAKWCPPHTRRSSKARPRRSSSLQCHCPEQRASSRTLPAPVASPSHLHRWEVGLQFNNQCVRPSLHTFYSDRLDI